MSGVTSFEPIAISSESTVVAEFDAEQKTATAYQSEAQLEDAFIDLLKDQAYEYLTINTEADVLLNLRKQLELLNKVEFSDLEWERFFREGISGENDGII